MRESLHVDSRLTDDRPGTYLVSTDDGTRVHLDLDARIACTFARTGPAEFRRRHRQDVELALLATCRVGEPMELLLDLASTVSGSLVEQPQPSHGSCAHASDGEQCSTTISPSGWTPKPPARDDSPPSSSRPASASPTAKSPKPSTSSEAPRHSV